MRHNLEGNINAHIDHNYQVGLGAPVVHSVDLGAPVVHSVG